MSNTTIKKIISDVIAILKKYTIRDALDFSFDFSLDRDLYVKSIDKDERECADKLIPWALEVFLKLSLIHCKQKYERNPSLDKGELNFVIRKIALWQLKFQNNLRNHKYIYMKNYIRYLERDSIEDPIFDIYRHYCYFTSNKEIYDKFIDRFNSLYDRFVEFALYFDFSHKVRNNFKSNFRDKLEKYRDLFDLLSCNITDARKSCSDNQDQLSLIYLRTRYDIHSYPILKFEESYIIPLYYMIKHSIGNILMFKFTYECKKLPHIVGKLLRENYLYKIVNDSKCYKQIWTESQVESLTNGCGISDVIATDGDKIIFLDSKSTYLYFDVLNLNDDAIEEHKKELVKYLEQMYKHIFKHCVKEQVYKTFLSKQYNIDDVYGIIVMRDFTIIKQEIIFDEVCKKLNITDSNHIKWMRKHIAFLDVYSVEKIVFGGDSLIDFMKQTENQMTSNNKLNMRLFCYKTKKVIYKDYIEFFNLIKSRIATLSCQD